MIVAVIQARAGSSRLPGKVLSPILGRPMLARQLDRVRRATRVGQVVVATSREESDDAVANLAAECGVGVFRGALDDVLDRVTGAAAEAGAEHVIRLTGDCPLSDPRLIDRIVEAHLRSGADYTANTIQRTFPDGLDVEVLKFSALQEACREARLPSEREHVTPFVYHNPERFVLHPVTHTEDLAKLRWVVDEAIDLEVVTAIFERLLPRDPFFGFADVLQLQRDEPALFAKNAAIDPEEGWRRSLAQDAAFREDEA